MRRAARRQPHQPELPPKTGAPGCGGKRCYADFATATRMADRTNRQRDNARVMPYRCRHCHSWHLGGHDGKVERRRRDFEEESEL